MKDFFPDSVNHHTLAATALDTARAAGASYADIRINRYRNQRIGTREDKVTEVSESECYGFGVRVLVHGTWGFASHTRVPQEEMASCARTAVAIAKANSVIQNKTIELVSTPSYQDQWRTPLEINPFEVSVEEKVEFLLSLNRVALKAKGAKFCSSSFLATNEQKFFASSEGSRIEQDVYRIQPFFEVTAVSNDESEFESRATHAQPMGCGYEYCQEFPFYDDARQAGEDAVEKLKSPPVTPGKYDLILVPSHLWLVIHESIGHATELDRALGFEANFAGTSFCTPANLDQLQYGSSVVNIVGDRSEPRGLATVGYDDEGVQAIKFDIIKNGTFVGYQTTREQAPWIGDSASHACAYADSFSHMPMQRMPNISLQPGGQQLSLDDLISRVENGILIKGDGSWSIDQQRYNFQFGGQTFYHIQKGGLGKMLRHVAYQSTTPKFWTSCEAVCSKEHYELGGSYYCGKGQPEQVAPVSHGSAPALFRNIDVINTGRKI